MDLLRFHLIVSYDKSFVSSKESRKTKPATLPVACGDRFDEIFRPPSPNVAIFQIFLFRATGERFGEVIMHDAPFTERYAVFRFEARYSGVLCGMHVQ